MKRQFWAPKIQGAAIKELKEIQLKLLKQELSHVYANSKFYHEKFKEANIKPSDITTLEDIRKIPITTRTELEDNFQDVLSVPFDQVLTIRQTSGTTGAPMTVAHSRNDVESAAEASARKLTFHGITSKDKVQVTALYGLFQGAWSIHWGLNKIGVCEIPVGPGDTERQIRLIKNFNTTIIYGVTNYHLRIAEVAEQTGQDLSKSSLRGGICVSEKPTVQQKERMKNELGYKNIFLDYGATEFPGLSVYCEEDNEGHHIWADKYLVEVVDPQTMEPLADGERGELVITSLQREASPLIRYSSRDIVDYYGFQQCSCGMCHPKIGTEIDRKDFMVKVRGVPVFPSRVEALLVNFPELTGRCQIIIDRSSPKQRFTIKAETNGDLSVSKQQLIKESLQEQLKTKFDVALTLDDATFVPIGVFEDKMKKSIVID